MMPDDRNLQKLHLSPDLELLYLLAALLTSGAHLASPEPFLILGAHSDTIESVDTLTVGEQDGDMG